MIESWSSTVSDDGMDDSLLLSCHAQVARHPWWRARTALVMAWLRRLGLGSHSTILDVGCGWGVVLDSLEKAGFAAAGLDVSRSALQRIDRADRRLVHGDLSTNLDPPSNLEPFDAILALDVIEHLDDDRAALARMAALVRPGGWVIVSVPARPDLWSRFDDIQGHRRRYLPDSLSAAFEDTGLQLNSLHWWGAWMVPLFRNRRVRRDVPHQSPLDVYSRALRLPPWPGPWLLTTAFALEKPHALAGRLRTGTSLFALARRPFDSHREVSVHALR